MSSINLASIIPPEKLDRIFHLRYPPAETEEQVMENINEWKSDIPKDIVEEFHNLTRPVLQDLSKFGPEPDDIPGIKEILPEPSDPSFFPRIIALVMLLDQCPRMYCSATTDVRWQAYFFDKLAQDLVWHVLSLPPQQSILNADNWQRAGYSYPAFLYASSLILTAADHSESLERQTALQGITEARREDIKTRTNLVDAFVERSTLDKQNIFAFSQWMRRGLPQPQNVSEFAYIRCAIIDIHWPIIEKFGRYPYRNSATGRKSTPEEEEFLEESGHFGEAKANIGERIKQDVEAGVWTPFGQDADYAAKS